MKVSCLQENLNRGLNIVGRAVATRATLPVTSNVLLATEQGRLKLAATNLEIAVSCWIGAKVEADGAITVPARLFADLVSSLPNDRIDLAVEKGTSMTVSCARNQAHISGMDADNFPPLPTLSEEPTARIAADVLREAIGQVAFAAATDESRPILAGVHAELEGDRLTLAAADGFRLAVRRTTLASSVDERLEINIPARALTELARLLADKDDLVEVTVNTARSQVLFHTGDVELVSQLVQGTFPDYSQLIPTDYQTRTVADVQELLRATRSASVFARDASGIVRLQVTPGSDITPGKMTISAQAEEVGDDQGEIDVVVEGEEAKVAFNGRYLTDVLSVLDKGQVALETKRPNDPGVIRPVDGEDYVHVVMPMFVQW